MKVRRRLSMGLFPDLFAHPMKQRRILTQLLKKSVRFLKKAELVVFLALKQSVKARRRVEKPEDCRIVTPDRRVLQRLIATGVNPSAHKVPALLFK